VTVDRHSWASPPPAGVRRFVPALAWLPRYDRGFLRFDVVAGATVWGLLVPEMIAYAGLAGVPPQAGLYTLLVMPAAYALLGTSRHIVAAGTSAAAVLLASTVVALHPAGSSGYLTDAAALVLATGVLFVFAGLFRLGFIVQFLSRPVIDGFVFGLAVFVTVKQLPKLFGIEGGGGDTIRQFGHLIRHLGDTNGITFAIGGAALVILFAGERWFPRIPGGLLVLVLGIGVSAGFDLASHGVDIVGDLPSGLPSVSVPRPPRADIVPLIAGAFGLLLVIFSESLGAAQNFASKYGYSIDANQELVALGVANAASGLIGGLPGGGSLSQSAVNEGAGARSELSPLVATVLAIVTVLFLTPLFKDLPEAVLAALIIHAVSHLWKVTEFREYRHERPLEFWVGIGTGVGVVTLDVLPGLVIGVISMLLLVVYHASKPHVSVLGRAPGVLDAYGDIGRHPDYKAVPGLLVLRLEAPLFYANASPVCETIKRLAGSTEPKPRAVIIDFGPNSDLDITSSDDLGELARTLRTADIQLALAEVRQPVIATAHRTGLLATIGEAQIYLTIDQAVHALSSAD
jgi:sulfate permease, SulP family